MARREAFVFLAIDGVANNKAYRDQDRTRDRVDPRNVELINQLINSISKFSIPNVVLSSSWRFPGEPGPEKTLELLRSAGYLGPAFTGSTPPFNTIFRGDEIHAWLTFYVRDHPTTSVRPNFVVLDDVVPLVRNVAHKYVRDRWVQTCDAYGIVSADVHRAVEMLRSNA